VKDSRDENPFNRKGPGTVSLSQQVSVPFFLSIRHSALALVSLMFVACTAIPISSMYSLSKIDPMRTDPQQIRVAIRVDESVNASRGSAQIFMAYKAEDHNIDEQHEFDVQLTATQTLTPNLTSGLRPGEKVTVMSLSAKDARTMRALQQRLYKHQATGGDGEGSFALKMGELCLDKELPAGDIPLTLFLKTENQEDYIVFIKYELHDLFSEIDNNIDALQFCEGMTFEDHT